jgi:hypothetical protein
MAYDPILKESVLFTGYPAASAGQTWGWNGTTWSLLATDGPSPRWQTAMAYDPRSQDIVLFGGTALPGAADCACDDTWTFDGSWHKQVPATSPPSLQEFAMAFDPVKHAVVVTGGTTTTGANALTWLWNGSTWRSLHSNPSTDGKPPSGATMSYDPDVGELALFGGANPQTGSRLSDTWVLSDSTWTKLATTTSPPPLSNPVSGYFTFASSVVLFGGALAGSTSNQTWLFNGSNWTQPALLHSPPPNFSGQLSRDRIGRLVLFGGAQTAPDHPNGPTHTSDQTWLFKTG